MIRGPSPDDICAMCDEYRVKDADPDYAALGMGICKKRVDTPIYTSIYVAWNGDPCVSHRLDRPNLAARRQYVQVQKLNERDSPP